MSEERRNEAGKESIGQGQADQPAKRTPDRPRIRFIHILPVVILLGVSGVFFVRLYGGDPSLVPSVMLNRPAPEFTLAPLEGLRRAGEPIPGFAQADLPLSGEDGTRVSIVNVWASWCVPCRDEHPALMELASDPEVRMLGINYKDRPENARRFLGALGNPFDKVGVDESGRSAIDWGVYGVPETFIVDAQGIIRYKHIGPIMPNQVEGFREQVNAAKTPVEGAENAPGATTTASR